jgi:hypothetical protein
MWIDVIHRRDAEDAERKNKLKLCDLWASAVKTKIRRQLNAKTA